MNESRNLWRLSKPHYAEELTPNKHTNFHTCFCLLQQVEQFSMGGGKDVVKLLVGNKIDQKRVVSRDTAEEVRLAVVQLCIS